MGLYVTHYTGPKESEGQGVHKLFIVRYFKLFWNHETETETEEVSSFMRNQNCMIFGIFTLSTAWSQKNLTLSEWYWKNAAYLKFYTDTSR
jgi:hypothetical protein